MRLRHATAQPVTRVDAGPQGLVQVFVQTAGIDAEFALPEGVKTLQAGSLQQQPIGHSAGRTVSVLLLTPGQAETLQVLELGGQRRLVLSAQQARAEGGRLRLRGLGRRPLEAAVFAALPKPRAAGLQVVQNGLMQRLSVATPNAEPALEVRATRPAGNAPRILIGGLAGAAVQPIHEAFMHAVTWSLQGPATWPADVEDLVLEIDFAGHIGRMLDSELAAQLDFEPLSDEP